MTELVRHKYLEKFRQEFKEEPHQNAAIKRIIDEIYNLGVEEGISQGRTLEKKEHQCLEGDKCKI